MQNGRAEGSQPLDDGGAVYNDGGTVTMATRAGTVSTGGESSTGITAQSIGGGGGNGGYSVSAGVAGAGGRSRLCIVWEES